LTQIRANPVRHENCLINILGRGSGKMIVYKVLCKNYKLKQGELIGALVERRKDLRGKSRVESGLKWARSVFGQMVRDKQTIFVIPHELNLEDNTIMPLEKVVFSKEEIFGMTMGLDQELKRKGGEVHNTIFSA
jgi:hypothetical protein